MELILKTDLEKELPAVIDFNYEAIKAELDAQLDKYRGLVIGEGDIAPAKKDRASLNHLAAALDEERKRVKKVCLAPYIVFEGKINELISMINEPCREIDNKIKGFEAERKEQKRAAIVHFYNDNIGSLSEILPLDRIYNKRWDNTTYKLIDITQEIYSIIERTAHDLQTISSLGGEFELSIKDKYIETLDLSEALAEKARLEGLRALLQARAAASAKAQAAQDASPAPAQAETASPAPQHVHITKLSDEQIPDGQPTRVVDFRIWATPDQLSLLKAFLSDNNIRYGRVPYQADTAGMA